MPSPKDLEIVVSGVGKWDSNQEKRFQQAVATVLDCMLDDVLIARAEVLANDHVCILISSKRMLASEIAVLQGENFQASLHEALQNISQESGSWAVEAIQPATPRARGSTTPRSSRTLATPRQAAASSTQFDTSQEQDEKNALAPSVQPSLVTQQSEFALTTGTGSHSLTARSSHSTAKQGEISTTEVESRPSPLPVSARSDELDGPNRHKPTVQQVYRPSIMAPTKPFAFAPIPARGHKPTFQFHNEGDAAEVYEPIDPLLEAPVSYRKIESGVAWKERMKTVAETTELSILETPSIGGPQWKQRNQKLVDDSEQAELGIPVEPTRPAWKERSVEMMETTELAGLEVPSRGSVLPAWKQRMQQQQNQQDFQVLSAPAAGLPKWKAKSQHMMKIFVHDVETPHAPSPPEWGQDTNEFHTHVEPENQEQINKAERIIKLMTSNATMAIRGFLWGHYERAILRHQIQNLPDCGALFLGHLERSRRLNESSRRLGALVRAHRVRKTSALTISLLKRDIEIKIQREEEGRVRSDRLKARQQKALMNLRDVDLMQHFSVVAQKQPPPTPPGLVSSREHSQLRRVSSMSQRLSGKLLSGLAAKRDRLKLQRDQSGQEKPLANVQQEEVAATNKYTLTAVEGVRKRSSDPMLQLHFDAAMRCR